MKVIQSNTYPIYFENSLQELGRFIVQSNYSKVLFLVDTHTEKLCLPLIKAAIPNLEDFDIIEIDPGEENKNIDFCIGIWKMMLDFKADRNSLLINLGGGVITDIGGFAASTFKRGIDFVQVPTTLLSQVDASVGGKTGIDMDQVKNIIGTFTQPKAVFIEPQFLKTLDRRQIYSGFAEVIKHGLIYDAALFDLIRAMEPEKINPEMIYRSVEIKNEVVTQDPYEKGLRKVLNFGHTIGHAVESYSLKHDKNTLLHGEAIAIGFICEAYLSVRCNKLTELELEEITSVVLHYFPKYSLNRAAFDALTDLMLNDKKNVEGRINFSLLSKIGACSTDIFCQKAEIEESLNYYCAL